MVIFLFCIPAHLKRVTLKVGNQKESKLPLHEVKPVSQRQANEFWTFWFFSFDIVHNTSITSIMCQKKPKKPLCEEALRENSGTVRLWVWGGDRRHRRGWWNAAIINWLRSTKRSLDLFLLHLVHNSKYHVPFYLWLLCKFFMFSKDDVKQNYSLTILTYTIKYSWKKTLIESINLFKKLVLYHSVSAFQLLDTCVRMFWNTVLCRCIWFPSVCKPLYCMISASSYKLCYSCAKKPTF